jgi:hypothetical protein
MKNEPIKVQDLQRYAREVGLFYTNFSEIARQLYADRLQEKIDRLKQSENAEVRELAEITEFLVDTYRITAK